MFYRTSSIVFFCIITVIVIHIYTIELCAIGEKENHLQEIFGISRNKISIYISNQILFLDEI